MNQTLQKTIAQLAEMQSEIPAERKALLEIIAAFLSEKLQKGEPVKLNFICTENSRRSHISHLWAAALAHHFGVPVATFSGGTKVSAFNPKAIAAMQRAGFSILPASGENPKYKVVFEPNDEPIWSFSKLYDAPENPQDSFIAIMVCGSADANCPFIPTAEKRFAVTFTDPKVADNTPAEAATYDERVLQIGSEFYYLFKTIQLN